ncbi:MAG: phosphatidylglycerol lysyltransferase domain-containing protein [Methanoregula sp.]|nr:MAG: phosphatidylglycerol lysyltransferase domain-containing protein [Methanoregula sp.]
MLALEDFKPVTLKDRTFFSDHYARYPQTHSDNTFTNMVCWSHYAGYKYAVVNGSVILSSTIDGTTRFRPPIGSRDPDLLKDVIRLACKEGDDEPMVLIDPDTSVWIQALCPDLTLVPDRNHFEYVYHARDLSELSGGTYLSIRRQLNRFKKNCAYAVEEITAENRDEVKDFLEKWCEWKGCEDDPVLAHEKEAIFFAVDFFFELGLSGLIIRVDKNIGAMSLFEPLNTDTALVHFEKGLPDCEGIYKAINAETAEVVSKDFTYINRESDLGVPGLREAKMRYHPHHMVEVFSLKKSR